MKECEKSDEIYKKEDDDKERLKEKLGKNTHAHNPNNIFPPKMEERSVVAIELRLSINTAKQQQQ